MNTVTHALLPVIATRLAAGKAPWLGRWGLIAVGIAGALPDVLSPHLSLAARMSSWSHGLLFWGVLTVILLLASLLSRRRMTIRLAIACSAAYLLHLFCDAISGGINWAYPVADRIWGAYWVDPILWVPLDILCLLACYAIFRLIPLWKKARHKTAQSRACDPL